MVPVRAYVKGNLGYQAAAQGLGTVKAGLRHFVTKDGPASGNGIETVSHWTDFAAEPTIQCYHAPIIANQELSPTGDRSGITFELVVLQPKSRGWVRLADSAPMSMPLINPNFIGDEEDLRGRGGIGARDPQGYGAGVVVAGDRGRDGARAEHPVGR